MKRGVFALFLILSLYLLINWIANEFVYNESLTMIKLLQFLNIKYFSINDGYS